MNNINIKKNTFVQNKSSRESGYAVMFAVILVSIISLISIGLSNTTLKQMMLASGAKDSQLAFYESDMAMECALYADNQTPYLIDILNPLPPVTSFYCGLNKNGNPFLVEISYTLSGLDVTYNLDPASSVGTSLDPCFRIIINKDNTTDPNRTITTIKANGYNTCNLTSNRTVERTIEVSY